jgi:hypothetical protein
MESRCPRNAPCQTCHSYPSRPVLKAMGNRLATSRERRLHPRHGSLPSAAGSHYPYTSRRSASGDGSSFPTASSRGAATLDQIIDWLRALYTAHPGSVLPPCESPASSVFSIVMPMDPPPAKSLLPALRPRATTSTTLSIGRGSGSRSPPSHALVPHLSAIFTTQELDIIRDLLAGILKKDREDDDGPMDTISSVHLQVN